MKVTVFGIGYVGLVQAATLAEVGHDVLCVDINQHKIKDLKHGFVMFYEPGLKIIVKRNSQAGRLKFTTDAKFGVKHGLMQFITVGTPLDKDGVADLKYVYEVSSTIAQYMTNYKIILNKSTVPVGTTVNLINLVNNILLTRNIKINFDIVSNPEFLKEGTAVSDCMKPERIIIGTENKKIVDLLYELYAPFNRNHNRIMFMDVRSAELTKYVANCILATKISFINEISNIAEILGVDIENVRKGIGSDSRIGYSFIYPGCGYGGSCFPKDLKVLINTIKKNNYSPKILQAVEHVNNQQKKKLLNLIRSYFGNNLNGKTFALWGLSFKPNTCDMREAPSRIVMEGLWQSGAKIQAYDPAAMNETYRIYGKRNDLSLMNFKEAVLYGADALIICTEWQNFRAPDFDLIKLTLKQPVIFDGRNIYDPERLASNGFIYYGIGRGVSINDFH